jgi:phage-related protein
MPGGVQDVFGYALHLAQVGRKADSAKVLKGFGSAGVLEVVTEGKGATFRAVYTVKIADTVYVLHCFQKKAKRGISTPQQEMDLIRSRLREAEVHAEKKKQETKKETKIKSERDKDERHRQSRKGVR